MRIGKILIISDALPRHKLGQLQDGDHKLELEAVPKCGEAVIGVHHGVDKAVPTHEDPERFTTHNHLRPTRKHGPHVVVHLQCRRLPSFIQDDPRTVYKAYGQTGMNPMG